VNGEKIRSDSCSACTAMAMICSKDPVSMAGHILSFQVDTAWLMFKGGSLCPVIVVHLSHLSRFTSCAICSRAIEVC